MCNNRSLINRSITALLLEHSFFSKTDISGGAGGCMSYLWKIRRGGGGGSSIPLKNGKSREERGSLVKFPERWGCEYFLEPHISSGFYTSSTSTRTGKFSFFFASTSHLFRIVHPPVIINLLKKKQNKNIKFLTL